uniref:Soluble diacylglycerol acyltransferase n=1 Tax=Arachis hypogaea TaxID=3818 RepID=Q2KP14_ARAHY|nr:soluble diacylglycerol acyltransferase [Arachis hypogaea]
MEVSGAVLRNVTCPSFSVHVSSRRRGGDSCVTVPVRMRKKAVVRCCCGFSDSGHVQYYGDEKKKENGTAMLSTKKKLKMLKKRVLFDDLQGNLTWDAAMVLMKQLEQVRAEEKELKKKRKQEKKEAKLKASKMNTNPDCESSSSSSSSESESESSESECDNEVVDMKKNIKVGVAVAVADSPRKAETMILYTSLVARDVSANHHHHNAVELFSRNNDISVGSINGGLKNENTAVITTEAIPQKRIEVCMGNKCKKSGSIALLQEFERVVGAEGGAAAAVVGCKCMGKCKSAPNVRIQNSTADKIAEGFNDSVKVPANPLCIGVAWRMLKPLWLRFLGENQESTNE